MNTPLFDTNLSTKERAQWIVAQLTIEEKFKMFASHASVERLNLNEYFFGGEAAHGVQARADQGEKFEPINTTSFTQPIGMAASFDKELIREAGNITGMEARAIYNMKNKTFGATRWAPTVDLCRDPRWGRNEEGYGEDPYLTGKMAGAFVEGLQDEHNYDNSPVLNGERGDRIRVGATLKHFYANNVEWRRCYDSFDVSDKVKFDYELESFRYCIEESHAEAVMTAYNGINGVTGMINPEVNNILKDKWGMKHAVCDGGAFQQVVNFHHDFKEHSETFAASVKAGVDNMLDNLFAVADAAKEAYEKGLITEEEIDKSLICMFETRIRLGAFDKNDPYEKLSSDDIGTENSATVSLKMAEENCILLKNDNGFLPLDKDDDFVVIGPYADAWYQDWYGGNPMYKFTLKSGVETVLKKNIKIETGLNEIRLKCNNKYVGAENCENPTLILVDNPDEALTFVHTDWGFGSNYLYSEKHKRYVRFSEEGFLKLDSIVPFKWYIFENLMFVPSNGAVKLNNPQNANMIEFNKYYSDDESDINIYGFGARCVFIENGKLRGADLSKINATEGNKEGQNMSEKYLYDDIEPVSFSVEIIKDGVLAAKKAALSHKNVIVALGCNPVINAKEEIDRRTIKMIPYQEKLLDEIVSVNKNVAVALFANYPYDLRNINNKAKAIVLSATGSQDMGQGMANVLFGKVNPAGRTPMTWYNSDDDLPEITDYDIINNKRTYRYFEKPVLYPFGYGLSYSEFKYSSISASKNDDGGINVSVSLTNVSNISGDEVCQIYIKRISASETIHPLRRLVGFERIHSLEPFKNCKVDFVVNRSDISIFVEAINKKIVEEGEYVIYAGSNCLHEAVSCKIVL